MCSLHINTLSLSKTEETAFLHIHLKLHRGQDQVRSSPHRGWTNRFTPVPSITSVVVLLGIHAHTSVIAAIVPGSSLYVDGVIGVTAHIWWTEIDKIRKLYLGKITIGQLLLHKLHGGKKFYQSDSLQINPMIFLLHMKWYFDDDNVIPCGRVTSGGTVW